MRAGYAIWSEVPEETLTRCRELTQEPVQGGGTRRLFERVPALAEVLTPLCASVGTDMQLCRSIS